MIEENYRYTAELYLELNGVEYTTTVFLPNPPQRGDEMSFYIDGIWDQHKVESIQYVIDEDDCFEKLFIVLK